MMTRPPRLASWMLGRALDDRRREELLGDPGARLIGLGFAIGLLLSIGVGMGLESLLIGIEPTDPITYAVVIGVLSVVAAAACMIPARRAASLDPAITLREG